MYSGCMFSVQCVVPWVLLWSQGERCLREEELKQAHVGGMMAVLDGAMVGVCMGLLGHNMAFRV